MSGDAIAAAAALDRLIDPDLLLDFVAAAFRGSGSSGREAHVLAEHLVAANLVGHDSHGVIRVPKYLEWVESGAVRANKRARIEFEEGAFLAVTGDGGYGQVIGREAMDLAIQRVGLAKIVVLAIRDTGHLGRIGAFAEQAAAAGMLSLHFVNTSGFGILVAPHGGADRRLSANPIGAGIPRADGPPIIIDFATSIIAEGKIQVARNQQVSLPEGAVIDGYGRPTTDPEAFYAAPPGAILPFGGHKGYALSLLAEVFAGCLGGGGASRPDAPTASRLVNSMTTLLLDPGAIAGRDAFDVELSRFLTSVLASPPVEHGKPVQVPGDIERATRLKRQRDGIPLDATTIAGLQAVAARLGLPRL